MGTPPNSPPNKDVVTKVTTSFCYQRIELKSVEYILIVIFIKKADTVDLILQNSGYVVQLL